MNQAKNMTEAKKVARDTVFAMLVEKAGLMQFGDAEGAVFVDVAVGEGDKVETVTLAVGVAVTAKQEKDTTRTKAFNLEAKVAEWQAEKAEKEQAAAEKAAEKAKKDAERAAKKAAQE